MPDAFPLEELQRMLGEARAADEALSQFGAERHRYSWNPPAALQSVEAFEQEIGIELPAGYRDFLLKAANGGAGPFCGLFPLEQVRQWLDWQVEPAEAPFLRPGVEADFLEYLWDNDENWKRGCIPIGSQGDTYFTLLIVAGPNRGRVVYAEYEASWVFFPAEPDFLAWYTRWLREVSLGYRIAWFATNLDGTEQELRQRYRQADTEQERREIIVSLKKFPTLSEESIALIAAAAQEWLTVPDACGILEILYPAGPELYSRFLEQRWQAGFHAPVVKELWFSLHHLPVGRAGLVECWWGRVLERLPQLPPEAWPAALQILRESGRVGLGQVAFLLGKAEGKPKSELLRAFSRFPDAKSHLELWLPLLKEREDLQLLEAALLSVPRVGEARLREALLRVQGDFSFAVELILHVDREDGAAMARASRRRMENQIYRHACNVWRDALREAINPAVVGIPRPYYLEMEYHDIRDLGMDRVPPPGCIRLNPLIALVLRDLRGRLPSTAYDWRRTLEQTKKLKIGLCRSTVRRWDDEGRHVYLYAPDEHFPPEPYFYDLQDWSAIGRMKNLRVLSIEEICVDDFSFLAQCKNVETLSLRNTNFSDCRLLLEMPRLKRANLSLCPLTHCEALEGLHLEYKGTSE